MFITYEQLKKINPKGVESLMRGFVDTFNKYATNYGITTPNRIQDFISQVSHECDGFKTSKEYASGAAYEGRKDLGNKYAGDGVKFKGRGFIQTTGRANYADTSKGLYNDPNILISNPKKLENPVDATLSAMYYWKRKGLNEISDKPADWTITITTKKGKKIKMNKFQYITYKINGGFNGLKQREGYLAKAKQILTNVVDVAKNNSGNLIITIGLFAGIAYLWHRS